MLAPIQAPTRYNLTCLPLFLGLTDAVFARITYELSDGTLATLTATLGHYIGSFAASGSAW